MIRVSTTVHPVGRIAAITILALLLSVTLASATGLNALIPTQPAEQQAAANEDTKQEKSEAPKITIPNLITYTTTLSEKLIDLQSQLAAISPAVDVRQEIPGIEEALESLNWKAIMQQADSNLDYKSLSNTMLRLNHQQDNLQAIAQPLNKAILILTEQEEYWKREQGTLTTWVDTLKNNNSYPLVEHNISELQKSIESAIETIESRMRESLATLHKVSGLKVKLYNLRVTAGDLMSGLRTEGWQQTSPPIFSRKFYSALNPDLLLITWQNAMDALHTMVRQVRDNSNTLILILFFPILFSIVFRKNRNILKKHKNWSLLASRPVAFSVFTCLISTVPWLGPTLSHVLPFISIAIILSVMLLAGKMEKKEIWVVRFIYGLSLYLALNLLVGFINLPLPLRRIYLLAGSCVWLAYFVWRISALSKPENRYFRWTLLGMSLALTAVIVAGILGYDELSGYLFNGTFLTIFIFISLVILFNTVSILFEVVMSLLPATQRYAEIITRSLHPLIFALCALLFYAITAVSWHLSPTSREAINTLVALEISVTDFPVSMKMIFMVIGILYGSVLVSRATRAILMNEVLPRYNIDKGVQLSITRLVHYAILLIGAIILFQSLGANLTKLTILGGALSVGIGFGLQTIVNNFASGLILLFERPIKVGDTIELGTDIGEVKKLGLRSTVIQTFDNAEIVVPNSELIAGQVTNWTLAERRARVKVPVGVAYGSDIPKVLEILLTVGGEHPMVLTTPAPNALFLTFGASSLDFELRVWVADFNDRMQVRSELNQQVNSEFADAGIEIPFPQTDLHLRTVDGEAAEVLRMTGTTRVSRENREEGNYKTVTQRTP